MLLLDRDSSAWKKEVYNEKGHQFVYFIRNYDSKTAKVGLHNRDIYALWQRYKTYYANFDAYIVRVKDSKYVEKKLFEHYDKKNLRVTNEMVVNNTESRDVFKYITSYYDLDYKGSKQTNATAQLVKNYHEKKPVYNEKKPVYNEKKPVYKYNHEAHDSKHDNHISYETKMRVSDKLNSVKDSIKDFFGFY